MFKLPKEADNWFSNIRKYMNMDFDMYYFCLMAALAKGEKECRSVETRDLLASFPKEYRSASKLIVALLLRIELDKMGVSLHDKRAMHDTIKKYIEPISPTYLSDEGQKVINQYAIRGVAILQEEYGEKPYTIEAFLIGYSKMIDRLTKNYQFNL